MGDFESTDLIFSINETWLDMIWHGLEDNMHGQQMDDWLVFGVSASMARGRYER